MHWTKWVAVVMCSAATAMAQVPAAPVSAAPMAPVPGDHPRGPAPLAAAALGAIGRLDALGNALNVTDEQKQAVQAILDAHGAELEPLGKAIIEKRAALQAAVLRENVDPETIKAAARDMGAALGDASVVVSRVLAEVRKLLTPEQIERLNRFAAQQPAGAANAPRPAPAPAN